MNRIWIRLASIAGVAAVLAVAQIDMLVGLGFGLVGLRELGELVGFIAIVLIALLIVSKRELVTRYASPSWVWIGMLVCALPLLLGPKLNGIFGYSLAGLLGFLNFPVVQTLASIGLLFMLLKLASDLQPQIETRERAADLHWRLIIVLTAFIGSTFSFIPTSWLPSPDWSAMWEGRITDAMPSWVAWVQWLISAAIAYTFVVTQRIEERIDDDRPGFAMLQVGVVIMALGFVLGWLVLPHVGKSQPQLVTVLLLIVGLGPIGLVAKFLVVFGALRLLFSLQPADLPAAEPAEGDAETPVVPAVPAQKSYAPARDYFAGGGSESEASAMTPPKASFIATEDAPRLAANAATRTEDASPEAELRAALAKNTVDPRRHDRLHRLLAADPARVADMLEHAKEYMAVLITQSLREQTLALYRACAVRDPNFRPNGDQVLPLVRLLLLEKDQKAALRVMNRFDATFPQHRDTAQIFYLSARILKDMHQLDLATKLLKAVITRFPQDKIVHDARTLLASLGTG